MSTLTKTEKKSPITFQLKGIDLIETCLNHPKQDDLVFKVFHFEIKIDHQINAEKKLFKAIITTEIHNEQKDLKLGSITANCIFEIVNISEFIDPKSKQINLPEDFISTINSITISTARGIMFDQFKGTFLHHALLPIVDPRAFVLQQKDKNLDSI